ncbi:MAG: SUMF1/EgtB/PvdO family nonheme iron enzyme, partial [Pirellulales bacterium]
FTMQTKDGVIRVEINDPQIEVAIKGTDIVLKQADNGRDVKISPGEKTFIVERGDFKFETDKLMLKKGETVTVSVALVNGQIKVMQEKREIGGGTIPPDPSKRFAFEIPDPNRARWSLDGDELVQSALTWNISIVFGDPKWEDFDFSVDAKRTDGNHACGLRCRYHDEWNMDTYWLADRSNEEHAVELTDNGKVTRPASRKGSLSNGQWHRLEMRVRGRHAECLLDGEQILSFDDQARSRGRIGLSTWDSAYRFRNIVVKAPDGRVLLEGLPNLDAEPPAKSYEADEKKALAARGGTLPTSPDGRPLNFDFETGDLRDWKAEGDAFAKQPAKGDVLHERYKYLRSRHTGQYWIGGNEKNRDNAKGSLTSVPFKVTRPYASFLMAGGDVFSGAAVELVRVDSNRTFLRAAGHNSDALRPVVVDLSNHVGREIIIRVNDGGDRPSARVSFDDFRFHEIIPDLRPHTQAIAQTGFTIDMLSLIDLDRDTFGGQWHWDEQKRLVGSNAGWKALQLPFAVPPEYDVSLEVEGAPMVNDFDLWLPIGGRQVDLGIDHYGNPHLSGLEFVDGKQYRDNGTAHQGTVFASGAANKLLFEVRLGSISVTCNGSKVIEWRGDSDRLSLPWQFAGYSGLAITGAGTPYRISKLAVTPVAPSTPVAPAGGAPPRTVAPFDAKQARAHQEAWASHLGIPLELTNSIGMRLVLIPPGEFTMGSPEAEIAVLVEGAPNQDWRSWFRSEGPQHRVKLTQAFYLGSCEVTQQQYQELMGVNPSHFSLTGPGKGAVKNRDTAQHPVEMVSWFDAVDFCNKLSEKEQRPPYYVRNGEAVKVIEGTGYRLPTEAEWEYA